MTDKLALDGGAPGRGLFTQLVHRTVAASDLDDVVAAIGKVVNGCENG